MVDKIKSVSEVVSTIPSGSHIALGGFAIARNPVAVVHELIRQQKKDLTLSQGVVGLDTDLLVGAGLVSHLIMGGGSLDRFGPAHSVNRARETKSLRCEDYTSLSVCFRYLAGALGLSYIPIKSLFASEILERLEAGPGASDVKRSKCPFTGEEYVLLRALEPDVSIVHVQIADPDGNCQINGARWGNEEQAKAGRRLIIVAEQIVPTEFIQRSPERTIIPGHRVEAIIHQPFGALPTCVYGCYDYDADHLRLYVKHAADPGRFQEYLKTFVFGCRDHWEFLGKLGGLPRMEELRADPISGY
ncbi:MAG: CoA transferase subunit A [Candidatus Acidiferrales bacterium]